MKMQEFELGKDMTIYGDYVSMKNSRRAFRAGARMMFVKKQKALDWEQLACQQIKRPKDAYAGNVILSANFYYASKRSDLDENLLCDMLQVKKPGKPCLGLIVNDNQIVAHMTHKFVDKENPRIMFCLSPI